MYIPPIALFLSILAMLLNIVTVLAMLLNLFGVSPKIEKAVVVLLFITIIVMPIFSKNNINSKIFKKLDSKYAIILFNWSSYWIKINYKLHS